MNKRSLAQLATLLIFFTTSGCETLFGPKQLPPATIPLTRPLAKEVSIEQLKRLLPAHPIVVGFDVDDTLIFSAPAFNALQPAYPAEVIRPKDYAALTTAQRRQYHKFWNLLKLDALSDRRPEMFNIQVLTPFLVTQGSESAAEKSIPKHPYLSAIQS